MEPEFLNFLLKVPHAEEIYYFYVFVKFVVIKILKNPRSRISKKERKPKFI